MLFVLDNLKRYFAGLPDDLKARNLPLQVGAMLRREQAVGRVRDDLDLRLAAVVLTGALGQLARSAHFHETPLDPAATASALARLLADGFTPRESR